MILMIQLQLVQNVLFVVDFSMLVAGLLVAGLLVVVLAMFDEWLE